MTRMGRKRTRDVHLPQRVYLRSGSYYFVRPDGKWIRLGRTEADMYQALGRLLGETSGTLTDLFGRYRREVLLRKAPRTQKDQGRQLARLDAVFGHMQPDQVRSSDIAAFLDTYPGPVQANRHVALLSHVYTKLIRWGIAERNPCTGVERNKEKPRDRYVTDDEFWAVWEMAPRHIQLLMELAYWTGQRLGDLVRLELADCRDDGIHITQGKTGRRIIIAYSLVLDDILKRAQAGVASIRWLIRRPDGQPYTLSGVSSAWQRLQRAALADGAIVERFTFHDIRAKSASDHPDGSHLGHTNPATLRRFYRRRPELVRGL